MNTDVCSCRSSTVWHLAPGQRLMLSTPSPISYGIWTQTQSMRSECCWPDPEREARANLDHRLLPAPNVQVGHWLAHTGDAWATRPLVTGRVKPTEPWSAQESVSLYISIKERREQMHSYHQIYSTLNPFFFVFLIFSFFSTPHFCCHAPVSSPFFSSLLLSGWRVEMLFDICRNKWLKQKYG